MQNLRQLTFVFLSFEYYLIERENAFGLETCPLLQDLHSRQPPLL